MCPPAGPHAATPAAGESRYLKTMYGEDTPVVSGGVCLTEGGPNVDAAITFAELAQFLERRKIKVAGQALHFSRMPEERRRHWSTAGGLPLEMLTEERQASRRFRKVRGLGSLQAIARAVSVDRIDLGFVDILPCEGCLDHPLLGPKDELFWRREIVGATEPARARESVIDDRVADQMQVEAAFPIQIHDPDPAPDVIEDGRDAIGTAPNGRPWDCGACGGAACNELAA